MLKKRSLKPRLALVLIAVLIFMACMPFAATPVFCEDDQVGELTLTVEDGVLKWDAVKGAISYNICIFRRGLNKLKPGEGGVCEYNIDDEIDTLLKYGWINRPADDNYELTVEAIDDHHDKIAIGSLIYNYDSYIKRIEPVCNGMLSWDPVEGAAYYKVFVLVGVSSSYDVGTVIADDFRAFDIDGALEKLIKGNRRLFLHFYDDHYILRVIAFDNEDERIGLGSTDYQYRPKPGWFKSEDGDWYHINKNGRLTTHTWMKDSKGWFFLGPEGEILINTWAQASKGVCWIGSDGYMVEKNQWVKYKGEWYHITNGYMDWSKWMRDSKGWCYLDISGKMLTNGWAKDSKGWCYLGSDGKMLTNTWAKDSKGWCWVGSDGYMVEKSKWIQYKGDWYYLKANGYMATGTQTIDGKTYKFDSSGKWIG